MIPQSISRVVVRKLFRTYDYILEAAEEAIDPHRLIILYGDNGTGKTTILRLLFHMLSPETGQGHKTALVSIPFAEFEIRLSSGDRVWIRRPEGKLTGSYTMGMKLGRRRERTVDFRQNEDGALNPTPETNQFLNALGDLNLALYFLSDDRSVRFAGVGDLDSPYFTSEYFDEEMLLGSDVQGRIIRRRLRHDVEQRAQLLLQQSIRRSEMWLQSQAVRGASQGESSVNLLYGEILKRISSLPLSSQVAPQPKIEGLQKRIQKLELRSREFSRYGLVPEFQAKDIVAAIKQAPKTHVEVIRTVVTPYIESVEKKLEAMESLQRRIDTLVGLLNSFYRDKKLSYDVHEGFTISTAEGRVLQPQMLSSGERHLLLLFCNTIQALDKPSLFVIDEPEISLNIKWQRRLLSALLKCAEGQPVQYILATHSLELLAQYRNNAIRLEPESEVTSGTAADD